MSGLFDSLTMASRSLQAQQFAMNVTGQNIANVNTPGYARRIVDFVSVPPPSGGGVDVQGVRGIRDQLLERRLFQELPVGTRDAAMADALGVVEIALGKPGESIDKELSAFFNAFATLAENPTSSLSRNQVVLAGQSLATAFADTAARLESARVDADTRVRATVDQINSLVTQIAEINKSLPNARLNGAGLTLEDRQSELVRELAGLADVHIIPREDGGVDLTVGNGRPLVVGGSAYQLAIAQGTGGYAQLMSEGVNITSELRGGQIGGLLQVRDTLIPGYLADLDALAYETASRVNALHTATYEAGDVAGPAFFTFSPAIVGSTGAAAAMGVNSDIVDNHGLIVAGRPSQPGDNRTAQAIANLRSERVLNGGTATLVDGWGALVYRAGTDSKAAADARDSQMDLVREVDALRDQVSGVSLDEEATNLLKFQRAYEANARFFTAVDRMLDTLMNTLGR